MKTWPRRAALLLAPFLAVELLARLAPGLYPPWELLVRKAGLLPGRDDWELGALPAAPRRQSYRWGGREIELRHEPFPERRGVGHRVGSRRGPPDLLLLGDSFSYAGEQPWEDGLAGRLEALGDWTVANLGAPGTGTRQHALLLERALARARPGLVVVQTSANDARESLLFERWEREREDPECPWNGPGEYMSCAALGLGRRPCRAFGSALRSSSPFLSLGLRALAQLRAPRVLAFYDSEALDSMERGLELIRSRARAAGAPLLVLLGDGWARRSPGSRDRLLRWAASRDVPILDLGDQGALPRIPLDFHWTAAGHDAAARRVHSFIASRPRLLPRKGPDSAAKPRLRPGRSP